MGDGLPVAGMAGAAAESTTGGDIAASAIAPARRKFRRERSRFIRTLENGWIVAHALGAGLALQMRSPALFIGAVPERHGFRIVQHLAVLVVQVQFTLRLPSDVRELQHGDGDVALCDGLLQLLALLNARDKVCEVGVRHRVTADQVRRSGLVACLERSSHPALQVVDLVAVAIDDYSAGGSDEGRPAVATVVLHPVAALPFPGDHRVVVGEAGAHGVVELPVVLELISPGNGCNAVGIVHAQCPTADVYFVRAIVERFPRAPSLEPVPVVGLYVVLVCLAWCWS